MINYQVNMNHYLYPKGYHPSKGTNGELQHFKNTSTRYKAFSKVQNNYQINLQKKLQKNYYRNLDWSN